MLDKTDRLTDRQTDRRMKGQSEIANMPKFNNNILENSQNLSKWLETKHNSKGGGGGGHSIIGNIDVDVGKFNLNDTLFL